MRVYQLCVTTYVALYRSWVSLRIKCHHCQSIYLPKSLHNENMRVQENNVHHFLQHKILENIALNVQEFCMWYPVYCLRLKFNLTCKYCSDSSIRLIPSPRLHSRVQNHLERLRPLSPLGRWMKLLVRKIYSNRWVCSMCERESYRNAECWTALSRILAPIIEGIDSSHGQRAFWH